MYEKKKKKKNERKKKNLYKFKFSCKMKSDQNNKVWEKLRNQENCVTLN